MPYAYAMKISIAKLSCQDEFKPSGRVIQKDLSSGKAAYPIPVVNDIDDDDVEPLYQYVEHNVDDVEIPDDCFIGCKCVGKCMAATCKCIKESSIFLYKDGRVKDSALLHNGFYSKILYECDEATCKCEGKCTNRMTPPTFSLHVELFKTAHAGYGVRARQYIPAGMFVAEFVGEILNFREAYIRPNPEDYSFQVVNQHSTDGHYVDPTRYGNISRFFNHSCFSNLLPVQYFSSHRYKKRASIGFIAFRDVLPGDELTIDYGLQWWERNVKSPKFFYCCCDWVYCAFPAPDKHQVSFEKANRMAAQICAEKHEKLMEHLKSKARFVKL